MSQLPAGADLDQLRRQARELYRAALGGDAGALRRLRQVASTVALPAAQLAIAREYGFAGWPQLTAEVEHRRDGQALLVWERFGYPDFLSAEAGELIVGQYAGRPQLRPVFDAVLAALPALGPATVQARKTMVSLVTPRRTFAVIQATTKTRVDLGLRLEHQRPGGRLLAARDLGAATVRIPLTRPEDVDAEVLGWLRRAYTENAAPPPPRRPARRPAPELGTLTVVIEAASLPGLTYPAGGGQYRNFHIGLATKSTERPALAVPGKPWRAADPVPGDAPSARWQVPVTVRRDPGGLDFSGPSVRGARDDRNLFLAWGEVRDDGTMRLVRGSKLKLTEIDPRLVEEAMHPGSQLVARIRLTGEPGLTWSAEPAHAQPGSG
jgi:hypothetical protein